MKKIFVVLATKNESDIIESYCRYNLTFCDGMIIYERQSSDNTNEIIRKLIAEGLPIQHRLMQNNAIRMIKNF